MSRPNTPTYKTKNWPTYNEALKRRGALTIWFDPEMTWEADPTGKRGRQAMSRATRHSGRRNTLAARSGDDGEATTAGAVQRRKCTV